MLVVGPRQSTAAYIQPSGSPSARMPYPNWISARRFEGSSPNVAVRSAYDQATAAPLPTLGRGVAGLVALAAATGKSGVVVEGVDDAPASARPDAELLALCREIAGCDRIAEYARGYSVPVWEQPEAFKAAGARLSEACRVKEHLIPRVIALPATTPAGALAKLRVVAGLFDTSRGRRSDAVRAVVDDLVAVLGEAGGEGQ